MPALLAPHQVAQLKALAADSSDEALTRRANILLRYHEGKTTAEVAEAVGLSQSQTRHWRREFEKKGMNIFPAVRVVRASADAVRLKKGKAKSPTPLATEQPALALRPSDVSAADLKKDRKKERKNRDRMNRDRKNRDRLEALLTDARKEIDNLRQNEHVAKVIAEVEGEIDAVRKKLKKKGLLRKGKKLFKRLKSVRERIDKVRKKIKVLP